MDYLSDGSLQKLHVMSKQYLNGELPAFVKNADIANERPAGNAPLTVYGDPIKRTFPCHSKVATWLSCLYFYGNSDKWNSACPADQVASRLSKAANYWGILPDIQKLQKTITEKTASPIRELIDDDYALAVNYGSSRLRRFPVVSAASVKRAAANLFKVRVSYPYVWRKKAALKILNRAVAYKASLDPVHLDYVIKAAGIYPADANDIARNLEARSYLYPDDIKGRMRKAATVLINNPQAPIDKLCSVLDMADRHYKKYAMYSSGLAMPEEIFYKGAAIKQASATDSVKLVTGNSFSLEDIKKAGLEPFTVLAPTIISAVAANDKGDLDISKVAEVLPTIPQDDARIFERALTAVGIRPVPGQTKQAFDIGKLSLNGFADILGAPKSTDFVAAFNLKHSQGLHDELAKKQAQNG